MFYEFNVTVSANTTEANASETVLQLTKGVIVSIEIQFPHGCDGLAKCRLRRGGATFLPTNPSGYFASSGHAIPITEEFDLSDEPLSLTAICWNEDDTFEHILYFRINVLRGEAAIWTKKILEGLERFLKFVGIKV